MLIKNSFSSFSSIRSFTTKSNKKITTLYNGTLSEVYRKLKVFSFGSLGAAFAISPIMAILDAPLNTAGRVFLISTALTTSITSTAMINWCGKPYVDSLKVLTNEDNGRQSLEIITHSFTLRKLKTIVHDSQWLRHTDRPLAVWEIKDDELSSTVSEDRKEDQREIIAETFDLKTDNKIGEWFVNWSKKDDNNLIGKVEKVGTVDR